MVTKDVLALQGAISSLQGSTHLTHRAVAESAAPLFLKKSAQTPTVCLAFSAARACEVKLCLSCVNRNAKNEIILGIANARKDTDRVTCCCIKTPPKIGPRIAPNRPRPKT